MRKILLLVGGVVLVGVLILLRLSRTAQAPAALPAPGTSAATASPTEEHRSPLPDLAFENYDGQQIRIRDFIGKPLVINVWASWCPFCLKELPDLATTQHQFVGQAVVVAINRGESRELAKRFTDGLNITPSLTFLLDPHDIFYQATGGFSMPESIFVDKKGFIREHVRGPLNASEMKQKIQELLNE